MNRGFSILGDSIAKGIVWDEARNKYRISSNGVSSALAEATGLSAFSYAKMGCTIAAGAEQLERAKKAGMTDYALICFGGNDSDFDWRSIARNNTVEHYPFTLPEVYYESYKHLLADIKKLGSMPCVLNLPVLISSRYLDWVSETPEARANILQWLVDAERIARFHEQYSILAQKAAYEMDCVFIDIRSAFLRALDLGALMCEDGIHPSEEGQMLMLSTIKDDLVKQNII